MTDQVQPGGSTAGPRFHILMPYYGDVTLMQDAVRSVLAQDGDDWRLTVVDDGKEAGVPEWFAALGDERVSYLRNERNLGVTGNFNRCLELSEGEFTVLMGCDDLLLPNYLRTVRAALDHEPKATMVQPGVDVIDGEGKLSRTLVDTTKEKLYAPKGARPLMLSGEDLAVSLLRGNWLYFPSICWRTEVMRKFRFQADLGVIQDLALVVDLLLDGASLVVTDTVAFQYRRHAVSESSAKALSGDRFDEARRFFRDTAERLTAHGWNRAAKASRRYWSSRLHALTLLPAAARRGPRGSTRGLIRHAFGSIGKGSNA
ncbi:glycosyltransferase [Streptomyces sp. NPDC006733]|uniref:glycosyltransferase n=1 Tax=Streptomyces sp. NPDC006733 TaxID=3155460 RepID=UPI00340E9AA1